MMERRTFLTMAAGGLLAAPLAAEAQSPVKVPKVGWLSDGVRGGLRSTLHEAFLAGLRDLGYVEGQTIIVERRDAAQKFDRLEKLAGALIGLNVNVMARQARDQPDGYGIPGFGHDNREGSGRSPRRQSRGTTCGHKEIAPKSSHVGVLFHPPFPATIASVAEARTAGVRLGLTIVPVG